MIASRSAFVLALLMCQLILAEATHAQQQTLGSIIGHIRVTRGDFPAQRLLVTLEFRGASTDSVYTDAEGTFGFHNLIPNPYYVVLEDEHYQPMRVQAVIDASMMSPTVFLNITLTPKVVGNESPAAKKNIGANSGMTDVREYAAHFPKRAIKEFKKGLSADANGKKEEAIHHYQRAVETAPDYYFAHNNLGLDYLAKSEFAAARKEFEQVLKLNQSDATAYFNLSNVYMQMGKLADAQEFLDEGMRRTPDSALGHFLKGSLEMRQGKLVEAERSLRQAIQLDPIMVQPRLQLVNLFLRQGRKVDAISDLHTFISTFPGSPFNSQAKLMLQRLEASANSTVNSPN